MELPAYLWGIETPYRTLNCRNSSAIASLPMRNWNGRLNSQPALNLYNCQPTYEELKLGTSKRDGQHFILLPAYLWGIETILYFPRLVIEDVELPAYLWGIETINRYTGNTRRLQHCQPTYEELKHVITEGKLYEVSHCQPTYEELKLKLEIGNTTLMKELPAYLWGIETQQPASTWKKKQTRLPAYLWGIETHLAPRKLIELSSIASLPMRNWNALCR